MTNGNVQDLINPNGAPGEGGGAGAPPTGEPPEQEPPKQNPPTQDKTFADSWKDYIPDELKDRSEWSNIKDVGDLYKNYINAQQMISKSVRLPDATSTEADIEAFYEKLGKPKDKTEYDFDYKPSKDEYKAYNKDSFDFSVFQDIAAAANLTKDQYQKLASAYVDINNENYLNYAKTLQDNAAEELKNAENKLKMEWGQNYATNINNITDKITKLYSKDTITRMQNAGLFRDADFLNAHLKLTKMMTGDTVFIEGNAVENVTATLSDLTAKRDKLMSEDYAKNRDAVLALNQQIVKLKQSQSQSQSKFVG